MTHNLSTATTRTVSSKTKAVLHLNTALCLLAGLCLPVGHSAYAQTTPTQVGTADNGEAPADIVVTGSRIKRPNLESASPITSIDAIDLTRGGGTSLGQALNDLPALRSTFSLGNSSRFIGTAGVNFVDLRGLGTQRTLVLINGRRQVGSLQGSSEIDINTISQALLERVDIETGGASAVYGSDAVSGVVNFITKTDFTGLAATAQGGLSSRGDAGTISGSLTAGTNFAGGKGNIAASIEFDVREDLAFADRSFSRDNDAFVLNPANIASENDNIPDSIFVRGTRSITFSDGGTICASANCRTREVLRFQPNGTLRLADLGTRDFRVRANGATNGARTTQGGDGSNFNRTEQLQPETQRYSANILFNYEFDPAAKLFVEGKYVRTNSLSFSGGPAFNGLGNPIFFTLDNPFLTQQAIDTLVSTLGNRPFYSLQRNNVDFGTRGEDNVRELYRGVVALKGDLGSNFNYELSYQRSESRLKLSFLNNRVENRFVNAVDAVRDVDGVLGVRGAIVCRATLEAGSRNTGDFDVDRCVPVNIFGEGNPAPEAISFINVTSFTRNKLTQDVVNGFISGDTESFFSLPGGPIGIALGGEYRRDKSAFRVPDDLNSVPGDRTGINLLSDGLTFLNALQNENGSINVKEAFIEARLPLFKDLPGVKELTLDAAYRIADNSTDQVGTINSYKFGLVYAPISDLRIRGSFSQAVRAPNVTELFSPDVQNFFGVDDPCDINNIASGSSTRAANCAALGIPAGFVSDLTATPEGTSGGNPMLEEETSRSYTIGAVFTPTFLSGFTLSVDFYRIRIKNAIAAVGAQDILDQCVDAATINNIFCPLVTRAGVNDPNFAPFNISFIRQRSLNFAGLIARGVDFDASYRTDINKIGTLTLRAIGTRVIQRDDFPFIAQPDQPDRVLSELGDPKWLVNFNANLKTGPFNIGYSLRYIGRQLLVNAEDVLSVGGNPPENPDAQDILSVGNAFYHSFRLTYNFKDKVDIYANIENIFDRKPPFGTTGTGGGSAIFDNIGRYITVGVSAKF
jgi:outer membrane receptor protein involved in Fe transport